MTGAGTKEERRPSTLAELADTKITISDPSLQSFTREDSASTSTLTSSTLTPSPPLANAASAKSSYYGESETEDEGSLVSHGTSTIASASTVSVSFGQTTAMPDRVPNPKNNSGGGGGRSDPPNHHDTTTSRQIPNPGSRFRYHASSHSEPPVARAVATTSTMDDYDRVEKQRPVNTPSSRDFDLENRASLTSNSNSTKTNQTDQTPLTSNRFKYKASKHARDHDNVKPNNNAKGITSKLHKPRRRNSVPVTDSRDAKFDLDGDGHLDEIEQAMRDRDVDGDGHLTTADVSGIVQDLQRSQKNVLTLKKMAVGLVCLVAILAASSFGTSVAADILSKDTVADSESGTLQSKKTGEVMAFQATSDIFMIEELSDEEFDEGRRLVDAEMAEDPDHEDHLHRQLGRKGNNNGNDGGSPTITKIAYDHGMLSEGDLNKLSKKCSGSNTVSLVRQWKKDGEVDEVYGIICEPGTEVIKKRKKKNNKNKTKAKMVDVEVTFKGPNKNGWVMSISFRCRKGKCLCSGEALHQHEGNPCKIQRDLVGASECRENLVCYDPDDHSATRGTGVCTRLQKRARRNQICDMRHGVNACEANYACYPRGRKNNARFSVGTVRTGICLSTRIEAGANEVCDVSLGTNACVSQYHCLGANGREIRKGFGVCTQLTQFQYEGDSCDMSSGGGRARTTVTARGGIAGANSAFASGPPWMEEGATQTKSVDGARRAVGAFAPPGIWAIIACPLGRRLPVIVQMAEVAHLALVSKVASMVVIAGIVTIKM
eukprot:CAMPEP_0196141496 /NCGR_PEP_ID=MMETSP0910-20130528/9921_1 /TAXON_ID=49265 /ORGANISM="Thalassiosira rotula, Strain GSO102" /LENGTH=770 /DNA_ID=CAMNT_0041402659 /DNA_START=104 /DNA_END=2417 /DNA_ORIENTATION=-